MIKPDNQIEMPGSWDRHLMPCGPWQHPRGAMHGLAHGEIRVKAGDMDLFQTAAGPDTIYPDGLITDEALRQQMKPRQLDVIIDVSTKRTVENRKTDKHPSSRPEHTDTLVQKLFGVYRVLYDAI